MQIAVATSVREYFAQLQSSDVKLEYVDGEIVAMAGAQPEHNLVCVSLTGLLFECLKRKGCYIFSSDQLIKVEGCESFYFPDLVIVCAKPEYALSGTGLKALTNPEVIIEILSPGTEVTDRVRKMDCYKTLESLKEYVLVSSTKKQVEVIKKLTQAEWLHHTYTQSEEQVLINGCEILLEDIYRQVDFALAKDKAG